MKKLTGQGDPNPAEIARGEAQFHKYGKVLNAHLKNRKWLLGDTLTIADFAVGAPLATAVPGQYPLADYSEIRRYYDGLSALPGWQKALAAAAT